MIKSFRSHKPNMLVHYSQAGLDVFTTTQAVFKVRTQGRVYCVDIEGPLANTSTNKPVKCALVFTHDALELFNKHPWRTFFIYKRIMSQHRTIDIGDITWDQNDTILISKDVLQIKKLHQSSNSNMRIKWQRMKCLFVSACDWLATLVILSIVALSIFGDSLAHSLGIYSWVSKLSKIPNAVLLGAGASALFVVILLSTYTYFRGRVDYTLPFEEIIRRIETD